MFTFQRLTARRAYTLVEILVTISITAVLLAMVMMNHSRSLTRTAFNHDIEYFSAQLKEVGTFAKKVGIIKPATLLTTTHKTKDNTATDVIKDGYLIWAICSRESSKDSTDNKIKVKYIGSVCSRTPITVGVSQCYVKDIKSGITHGVWVDLFSSTTPEVKDFDVNNNTPVARIIFEPNSLPHSAGMITFKIIEKNEVVRSQRIDIERSGVITLNTASADKRLGS